MFKWVSYSLRDKMHDVSVIRDKTVLSHRNEPFCQTNCTSKHSSLRNKVHGRPMFIPLMIAMQGLLNVLIKLKPGNEL